ncbi:MAG: histone deacetylase family protein, partial [Gallionella sp.]|nr:histone deacetylase family protein [Gallionella sp.]
MTTAYLTHSDCLKHEMGAEHPECPARLHAIEDQLISSGLLHFLAYYEAPEASREQLLRVHGESYVAAIHASSPLSGLVYLDGDTAMNPFSLAAAFRAAGAAVKAVDLVMAGQAENAFCNIRPPGHHAGRDSAGGFCIFNNVAVAAAHALAQYGLERVAIADFDVHHGDGTEGIFKDD